jgi:DNA-binding LacI/PurR family transcriptional regulator
VPPGLKDVAALAGVSIKTVSNVVNGYVHVAPETRARVQAAVDELGYKPNVAARQLRSGRSGVIALALPELQSPYFAEIAGLIVQAAERRSWTVLIDQTDGHADRERNLVAGLRRHAIDGLIFSPLALAGEELTHGDGTPMVLLGERVSHGPADHVAIDNEVAAADATAHLAALGRTRIAAIGAQDFPSAVTAHQRLAGYRRALADAGLPAHPSMVAPVVSFHRSDGAAAMAGLLAAAEPPDAVFCFNDLLALGAIRTLLRHGVRVPEDIAVVGFDNIEDGQFSTPTLSTVAPDMTGIAEIAIELLAERMGQSDEAPREVRVTHRLVARESTRGRETTT